MRDPSRLREATVLLAVYKHDPEPVTFAMAKETIRNVTAADLAHVERIAAGLEARDRAAGRQTLPDHAATAPPEGEAKQ